ncbi:fungal-specific transcription factor domain-containing protein [Lophiotrema nucula]|uniref:Fungal-specific transcription factor domain-containing protein n=1 Tax=Lophiotrema nucula TaxID=690887 RepID=A0A6A5YF04_9PLEO|nr:fungal-specific transcription factor domain-containing protein [Lophiotrema nucula]
MASAAIATDRPTSKSKQKHVTTACLNCRTRKIKCDAAAPSCSNCVLYSQQCVYQHGLDKRKIPIKDRYPLGISPASDDASSPLVDRLAGNLGSLQIAEDGQLRFYGATSNLHLLVGGARKPMRKAVLSCEEEIQSALTAARVGHIVDPGLEQHLLKLYFCWEDPSIHVVKEDIFYRERARCKAGLGSSKLYSEVLVNAMCAVGASLTSRHCVELPEPLEEFFASRAKALLDVEMDSPTLSTVQSLVILSGVESLLTRDARGSLNSGMAMRLATDLGLHLDTQSYVVAGLLDSEEAIIRRVVFWGTFIHERMWSLYMGRPVSLDEKNITVPAYIPRLEEAKFWRPYVDDFEELDFPPLPDPIEELHEHNSTLCAKMTRVQETLYSDSVTSLLSHQELHDFTSDMRSELRQWLSDLPEKLHVDLKSVSAFYTPHVLQLHMQCHCVMILVNRPFFSASIATQPDVAFADPMVGRPACTESARTVSKLLQIYRRLFGLRRIKIQAVHLVFTASLIHVLNACQATEPSLKNSAWQDLEVCSQALMEMSKGYRSATRALEVVNGLKDELVKAARENTKRSAAGMMNDSSASKRRRSSAWSSTAIEANQSSTNANSNDGDLMLNTTDNALESLFWSEFTSLDFPGF